MTMNSQTNIVYKARHLYNAEEEVVKARNVCKSKLPEARKSRLINYVWKAAYGQSTFARQAKSLSPTPSALYTPSRSPLPPKPVYPTKWTTAAVVSHRGEPDRKRSTRIRQQQAKGVTRCAELLVRSTHVPGLATLTRVLIKLKGLVFVRGIQAPAVLSTRGTWRSSSCVLPSVASFSLPLPPTPSHPHPFTPTSFN